MDNGNWDKDHATVLRFNFRDEIWLFASLVRTTYLIFRWATLLRNSMIPLFIVTINPQFSQTSPKWRSNGHALKVQPQKARNQTTRVNCSIKPGSQKHGESLERQSDDWLVLFRSRVLQKLDRQITIQRISTRETKRFFLVLSTG